MAPDWLWIVLTLAAAATQTARNALQRDLTATLGAIGATHARFLYGLPFALLFFAGIVVWRGAPPAPGAATLAWAAAGGLAQIGATALLLAAMRSSAFLVAVAYTKAEPVLVLLAAWAALGEAPTPLRIGAILLATGGVMLMSWPSAERRREAWGRPVAFGLASGALFAVSAVCFRSAILTLEGGDFVLEASLVLVLSLAIQTATLSAWLALRDPETLRRLLRTPLKSAPAGLCGAVASQFWFLAFALQSAALVRTLGLTEILFSQIVTRRLFAQEVSRREYAGIAALGLGLVGLLLGG